MNILLAELIIGENCLIAALALNLIFVIKHTTSLRVKVVKAQFLLISLSFSIFLYHHLLQDGRLLLINKTLGALGDTEAPLWLRLASVFASYTGHTFALCFGLSRVLLFVSKYNLQRYMHILSLCISCNLWLIGYGEAFVLNTASLPASQISHQLQDLSLCIHPLLTLLSYLSISLSICSPIWIRQSNFVTFGFLTLAITTGSYWAYYELGWGGWWFWDNIEVLAFILWLLSLLAIHQPSRTLMHFSWMVVLLTFILLRTPNFSSAHSFGGVYPGLYIWLVNFMISLSVWLFKAKLDLIKPLYPKLFCFSWHNLVLGYTCLLLMLVLLSSLGIVIPYATYQRLFCIVLLITLTYLTLPHYRLYSYYYLSIGAVVLLMRGSSSAFFFYSSIISLGLLLYKKQPILHILSVLLVLVIATEKYHQWFEIKFTTQGKAITIPDLAEVFILKNTHLATAKNTTYITTHIQVADQNFELQHDLMLRMEESKDSPRVYTTLKHNLGYDVYAFIKSRDPTLTIVYGKLYAMGYLFLLGVIMGIYSIYLGFNYKNYRSKRLSSISSKVI